MQIHELSSPRRANEGLGNWAKELAKQATQAASPGTGKSAGILDPEQKLAAVKREPAMVRLAGQYAKEWMAKQAKPVPEAEAVTTYNRKTGQRTVDGKPQAAAFSELPPNVQQQILAKQQAATPAAAPPDAPVTTAPAKSTGTAMPVKPLQVPGAGTNSVPTNPVGYTAAIPLSAAKYRKDFLAFVNEKIAMRDPSTYQMIGLTAVEQSKMKPLLDTAKQKVMAAHAQGDPAGTELAVKDYILTAMAGAQLAASENAVKQPQAPAYGTTAPAGQAPTSQAPTSQAPATQTAPANAQVTSDQITGLIATAGLDQPKLSAMGSKLQQLSGNKVVSSTGDSGVDQLLRSMGYTVS
jgi:hypothetical protein